MKKRLQVFISSTFTDLIPERQAAVGAILKAGHIPAGMELFTAGDRSQMATIKQWINESDVYMLILGGRYGSVEPTTGLSYTELEYDYAIEQSKPIFAVVITDDALEQKIKTSGSAYMEKDNPKELKIFRAKVLGNISSFFEDSKDIRLCVHESLADFAANRELKGWVPGDEIADTKPLFEEIAKLSEENKHLKNQLTELERKATSRAIKIEDKFQELREVLSALEIEIPANVTENNEGYTTNLLRMLHKNSDLFVSGVTNAQSDTEVQHFLYFKVCPKLQVHGLMKNEKVSGVRYRRYAMTDLGTALLAHLEKEAIYTKAPKEENTADDVSAHAITNPTTTTKRARAKKTTGIKKASE